MKAYGAEAYAGPYGIGGVARGGYYPLLTRNDCDVDVSTPSSFRAEIVKANRRIWLSKFIDLTPYLELQMADGVLLASNLSGGIYNHNMNAGYVPLLWAGANCRFLGIIVEGPDANYHSTYAPPYSDGIGVGSTKRGVKVESCEIRNWQYGGVRTASDTQVLFSYLHHCRHNGIGYGVSVGGSSSDALIMGNYFDACRHFIMGECGLTSYEACFNEFGPTCDNTQIDCHGGHDDKCGSCNLDWACHDANPAGRRLHIHHNTHRCTYQPPVGIRGVPAESCICDYEWSFYRPSASCDKTTCSEGWKVFRQILCAPTAWTPYNYEAAGQRHRMWQQNNWFGPTEPPDILPPEPYVSHMSLSAEQIPSGGTSRLTVRITNPDAAPKTVTVEPIVRRA